MFTKVKTTVKLPLAPPLRHSLPGLPVVGKLMSNVPAFPCTLRETTLAICTGLATQVGNLKLPMRVCQGAPGSASARDPKYSFTYQNVQSSVGSTVRSE